MTQNSESAVGNGNSRAAMGYVIVAAVFLALGWFLGSQQAQPGDEPQPVMVDETQLRAIIRGVLLESDIAKRSDLEATEETDRFALVDDDPYLGDADAPVVIVEFSDFFCAYCRRHFENTFAPLLENYGRHIRYVYRDFARLNEESPRASAAAQCAFEQGKFWEFHSAFFANQGGLNRDFYLSVAEANELDMAAYTACLDDGEAMAEVELDGFDGQMAGVRGTPSFFINGQAMSGAQPFSIFERMVQRALDEAGVDYRARG